MVKVGKFAAETVDQAIAEYHRLNDYGCDLPFVRNFTSDVDLVRRDT